MKRHIPLVTNHFYHIYNKSIYGYTIFNAHQEYERMLQLTEYYRFANMTISFSQFYFRYMPKYSSFMDAISALRKPNQPPLVKIYAFCLMPTHTHFLLQQLAPNGIQIFMRNIQSAYTLYFNKRHNRLGPLWQNRFGNKIIDTDSHFHQIVNYIHNNPVKDLGIKSPEDWIYSSANPAHSPGVCRLDYSTEREISRQKLPVEL